MNSCAHKGVGAVLSIALLGLCASVSNAGAFATRARDLQSGIAMQVAAPDLSDMAPYSDSQLVMGDSASVVQLDVPSAGVLSLNWTDLDFTSSLANLDVELSNGLKTMGSFQADGSTKLNMTGPEKLYVTIFATAQGSWDMGLYHFSAEFTPAVAAVPLPGLGVVGLGTALLGILALGWRRRNASPVNI